MATTTTTPPSPPDDRSLAAAIDTAMSTISFGEKLNRMARSRDAVLAAMNNYLTRLGLDLAPLDGKIIHVAGTKGKGSTSVMCESILRASGLKTGLFISPHLVDLRERIRLQGRPVSAPIFLKHFWTVWDRLVDTQADAGDLPPLPGFFHFMCVLALYIFVKEEVDVVVLEVGIGGRLDATNIIPAPAASAVTTLDFDHVHLLGGTLPLIAKEKAGIFKPGVPAFTVPQPADALAVLESTAVSVGAPFTVVEPSSLSRRTADGQPPALGLNGDFQKTNAALAVLLCETFLEKKVPASVSASPPPPLAASFLEGLATARFGGRAQVLRGAPSTAATATAVGTTEEAAVPTPPSTAPSSSAAATAATATNIDAATVSSLLPPNVTLYLDGAHTERSMQACCAWLRRSGCFAPGAHTTLLFNCGHEKDALQLLVPLSSLPFDAMSICPFDFSRPSRWQPPTVKAAIETYLVNRKARGEADGDGGEDDGVTPAAAAAGSSSPLGLKAIKDCGGASTPPAVLSWQESLGLIWGEVFTLPALVDIRTADLPLTVGGGGEAEAAVELPAAPAPVTQHSSIRAALDAVCAAAVAAPDSQFSVVVTGSLYIVGGVLAKVCEDGEGV